MTSQEYDLFERRQDGSLNYRGVVSGLENARVRVHLLANETDHECFAIQSATQEVVARVIPPGHDPKRIFQIAYDPQLLDARASLLRRWGYQVTSAVGNEAAKRLLRDVPQYDLFIIGHGAPEPTRLGMVQWLREHYPHAKILALNPPPVPQLDELHYNAFYTSQRLLYLTQCMVAVGCGSCVVRGRVNGMTANPNENIRSAVSAQRSSVSGYRTPSDTTTVSHE